MLARVTVISIISAVALVLGAMALFAGSSDLGDPGAAFRVATTAEPSATPVGDAAVPSEQSDGSVCGELFSRPDPSAPRAFPAEYTQIIEVNGISVVGNRSVDRRAFEIARETIEAMFADNDLEAALASEGAYVVIASADQGILDIPEFECLVEELGPGAYEHVCGVADRADYPVATVNELDLLGSSAGPCGGLNILYHEIGHLVQNWTLPHADYIEVRVLYQGALDEGLYQGMYASTNSHEYFAEGTQSYFHFGGRDGSEDREWLAGYDPELYALLAALYGG